ncbi:MAG: hypothetical protein ABSA96_16260, partial [Candidatus Acidiferrales bacterium]
CAAMASHALKQFPPAWCLAIAPPGSAKTDLLESFRELPGVHFVDELTTKTFLSGKVDERGKKRERPASWLHRIGDDGVLVAADFSTFTADPKALQVILAQLRRIYDGNYSREYGTDENIEERTWEGRLTLFAGAVPDIDKHWALFQRLGERFLRVRWPRAGGVETALMAMKHTVGTAKVLREAVHSLLKPILEKPNSPAISAGMEYRIANLSELIALSRSYIERERITHEVVGVPITEGNTRLPQQLCQIARGSALLDGRTSISEGDFKLICRVAFDSLPPVRQGVLKAVMQAKSPFSEGLPPATTNRAVEDLRLTGVLTPQDNPKLNLTDLAQELLREAGLPKL